MTGLFPMRTALFSGMLRLSPFIPFFTVWLKVFFLGINRLWYVLFGGYYSRFWVIFNLFLVVLFSDTTPLLYSFLS